MSEPVTGGAGAAGSGTERSSRRVLRLVGGFTLAAGSPVPRRLLVVTAVGGLDADLTRAVLPVDAPVQEIELTKISLVGGVRLVVPPGTAVETDGASIIGHVSPSLAPAAGEPVRLRVRLRSFAVFGGVHVSTG
jgi:hypothetical protein